MTIFAILVVKTVLLLFRHTSKLPETIKIKRLQYNGINNVYLALFNKK